MGPYNFSSILCVTIFIQIIYGEGADKLMRHYEGEIKCKYYGGLIDYELLINDGSVREWDQQTLDDLHIVEGQAIWIHGYAKMSSIAFSWYGCFFKHSIDITFENVKCRIHDCYDICSRSIIAHDVMFIGISFEKCHCITRDDSLSLQPVNGPSMCRIVDVGYEHSCPKPGVMNVYKIHRKMALPNQAQCLSTKKTENAYILSPNTCFSPSKENIVFACACPVHQCISMNDSCEEQTSDIEEPAISVCFRDVNTSWFISRKECYEKMGRIVNPFDSGSFRNSDGGKIFWTNMFHTFELTGPDLSAHEQHWSCLAATRVGNVLYIDPDDCSAKKEIICSDDFRSVTLPQGDILSSVALAVVIAIIVVSLGACVCLCRYLRRKQQNSNAKETTYSRQMSRLNGSDKSHRNADVVDDISEHSTIRMNESCNVEIHVQYRHEDVGCDSGQNVNTTSSNVQGLPSSTGSNAYRRGGNESFPTKNSIKQKGIETNTQNTELINSSDDCDAVHG